TQYLASPFQLTRIRDLAPADNVDTITLQDILGDPMIKECWNFNFLFDIDFVMRHFDPDIRTLVQLNVVHGFWKTDDDRRIALEEASEVYSNVKLISAYMPDPFGTHHSKMLILVRHDEHAQVVIHTANMISRDWGNMTQAVWRSPLLSLLDKSKNPSNEEQPHRVGSGERFKSDLLRYLSAYGKRLTVLIDQVKLYDCSPIRAAFIGSTPSRQKLNIVKPGQTSWGWLGLQDILSTIPSAPSTPSEPPHIVIQISSIATLGQTTNWLSHFQSVLSTTASPSSSAPPTSSVPSSSSSVKASAFFAKRTPESLVRKAPDPKFNVIFPTASEIRTSLDGYASGASIHTKLQSAAQQKQLIYLRPILCHWRHSSYTEESKPGQEVGIRSAGRGPAAPHIKTYIRFKDESGQEIDWAMLTSANLSKQAWGDVENKNGEVWIQSWETGVVVWPGLFSEDEAKDSEIVKMVPTFGTDMPSEDSVGAQGGIEGKEGKVVGLRMPYDLPLESYKDEVPWCATARHMEPDWKGKMWKG
ncbi:phospholipase D/nuclease, partial [Lophiostoma macrostomum CBS 122681]